MTGFSASEFCARLPWHKNCDLSDTSKKRRMFLFIQIANPKLAHLFHSRSMCGSDFLSAISNHSYECNVKVLGSGSWLHYSFQLQL